MMNRGLIVSFFFFKGSVSQWRTVYCVLASVLFVSNLFFVIYGSADVQKWNNPKEKNHEKADEETQEDTYCGKVEKSQRGMDTHTVTNYSEVLRQS